jgi:hypothetical protein
MEKVHKNDTSFTLYTTWALDCVRTLVIAEPLVRSSDMVLGE